MKNRVKVKPFAVFWLIYFVFSISWVGGFVGYATSAPIYLLALVVPDPWKTRLRRLADHWMVIGIGFLMKIQPWFRPEILIHPEAYAILKSDRGCLLISNHRSHLDAFILLSRIQGVRILAKHVLFSVPFLGMMMRLTRQIPVRRGQVSGFIAAMDQVRSRLKKKEKVNIFPEMTRCPPGFVGTQSFLLAPFHVAVQEKTEIIPVVFQGTDDSWPKGFPGIRFRRPVRVQFLAPLFPENFSSASEMMLETKKQMNQALSRHPL